MEISFEYLLRLVGEMKNYIVKNMDVEKVRVGMTVAKDIYSKTDLFLVGEDTRLNDKIIKKLMLYQVNNIPIKELSKIKEKVEKLEDNSSRSNEINLGKSVENIKQFKEFSSIHENRTENLKKQILDISEGNKVDLGELFSISDGLISSIDSKSDLFSFINNLESFDDVTYTHSVNVSLIAYTLGKWLGYDDEQLKEITVAGLLHDIGKTKISKEILDKPNRLTDDEYEEIKKHPVYSFKIIEDQDLPYNVKMAILMHHERYDGSGYPLGVKNEQISDYGKIIAIADIYDAMTSNRSYRGKHCPFEVIEHLEDKYLGKLDTKFLMTFLHNIAYCYLGRWVQLSTGEEAKIVFINKQKPSKPMVQVDNVMIDLGVEQNICIEKIL